MRSVIAMAPSTAEASPLDAVSVSCASTCAGVCAASTLAANVEPVVKRNLRRLGCVDPILSSSIFDLTQGDSSAAIGYLVWLDLKQEMGVSGSLYLPIC
jgi:hypothetical protein